MPATALPSLLPPSRPAPRRHDARLPTAGTIQSALHGASSATHQPLNNRRYWLVLSLVICASLLPAFTSHATTHPLPVSPGTASPAIAAASSAPADGEQLAITAPVDAPDHPGATSESTAATPTTSMAPAASTALQASPPTLIDTGMGLSQVLLSLGFIVALLLFALWLLKRLSQPQGSAGRPGSFARVISATALGQRERVVIVEVADTWLVLGVANGQISKLHELPRQTAADPAANPAGMQDFASRLKQLLGPRHVV